MGIPCAHLPTHHHAARDWDWDWDAPPSLHRSLCAARCRYDPATLAAMYRTGSASKAGSSGSGGPAVRPVAVPAHDTPALRQLDVSYHSTANAVGEGSLAQFLIRPTWDRMRDSIRCVLGGAQVYTYNIYVWYVPT